jgi:hypothetical protein
MTPRTTPPAADRPGEDGGRENAGRLAPFRMCPLTEPHGKHTWQESGNLWECDGLPDALLGAVMRLAAEWAAEADEDERWLNGPHVHVSEAREYPATIRQARAHAAALRALAHPTPGGTP